MLRNWANNKNVRKCVLRSNQNQGKKNAEENWEREERTAHQTISHRIEQLSSAT